MTSLYSYLGQAADLLLVVLGFSLIIVIHELGHFVAARWAGIRVLAFAVGFGPALLSYRRGVGLRRGSSEPRPGPPSTDDSPTAPPPPTPNVSPTEYRLNALPFGGYVKMLGQDDASPEARSDAPDSYQSCPPWKRMIVISAGVTANIVTAAILFIIVFTLGLRTEPAKIGLVEPGSPAATTAATNAAALGVVGPGLRAGDEVLAINGEKPLSFNDLQLASMIARRGTPIGIDVRRPGVEGVLNFKITPVQDPATRLLHLGVGPAASNKLADPPLNPSDAEALQKILADRGLADLKLGMTLVSVEGRPVSSAYELAAAIDRAAGSPVQAVFRDIKGNQITTAIPARPALQRDRFMIGDRAAIGSHHVLGLMPVLQAENVAEKSPAFEGGLRSGDIFVQLGAVEWPSIPAGIDQVRSHKGGRIKVVVGRPGPDGRLTEFDLGELPVNSKGQIGFAPGDTADTGSWIGAIASPAPSASISLPRLAPGSRIITVDGSPTGSLAAVRAALSTAAATPETPVTLAVELPIATRSGNRPTETLSWTLGPVDVRTLTTTAWEPALDIGFFEPETFKLQAVGIGEALGMGLRETKRVMLTTYLTFARLAQGTVKIEHLKGPVGIAHLGTILADRGFVWLLFFMALISVNLAVINFLPVPIADGGHFLFLIYEQITGKPVSIAVQNVAAVAGLLLLASLFLVVTFNDISNLFRG